MYSNKSVKQRNIKLKKGEFLTFSILTHYSNILLNLENVIGFYSPVSAVHSFLYKKNELNEMSESDTILFNILIKLRESK